MRTAPRAPARELLGLRPLLYSPERHRSRMEACGSLRSSPQAGPKWRRLHLQPPGRRWRSCSARRSCRRRRRCCASRRPCTRGCSSSTAWRAPSSRSSWSRSPPTTLTAPRAGRTGGHTADERGRQPTGTAAHAACSGRHGRRPAGERRQRPRRTPSAREGEEQGRRHVWRLPPSVGFGAHAERLTAAPGPLPLASSHRRAVTMPL